MRNKEYLSESRKFATSVKPHESSTCSQELATDTLSDPEDIKPNPHNFLNCDVFEYSTFYVQVLKEFS